MGRHQTRRRGQASSCRWRRCQDQAANTPRVLPMPVGMRMRRVRTLASSASIRCHGRGFAPPPASLANHSSKSFTCINRMGGDSTPSLRRTRPPPLGQFNQAAVTDPVTTLLIEFDERSYATRRQRSIDIFSERRFREGDRINGCAGRWLEADRPLTRTGAARAARSPSCGPRRGRRRGGGRGSGATWRRRGCRRRRQASRGTGWRGRGRSSACWAPPP